MSQFLKKLSGYMRQGVEEEEEEETNVGEPTPEADSPETPLPPRTEADIEAEIEAQLDYFKCRIQPTPAGCATRAWETSQSSLALDRWLEKHMGEGREFSSVEKISGEAVRKCMDSQRDTIRQRLLVEAGLASPPPPPASLPSILSAAVVSGGIRGVQDEDEQMPLAVEVVDVDAEESSSAPPPPPPRLPISEDFELHPVPRVPHGWKVRAVYCINIPEGVMRYNAIHGGHFDTAARRSLAHKTLLFLVGKSIGMSSQRKVPQAPAPRSGGGGSGGQRSRLGRNEPADSEATDESVRAQEQRRPTFYHQQDSDDQIPEGNHRFDFRPEGPDGPCYSLLKTTQVIEHLMTVNGEHRGWRMFFFVHGDTVDLANNMSRVMANNLKIRQRHLQSANRKTSKTNRAKEKAIVLKAKTDSMCYENPVKPRQFLDDTVVPYLGYYNFQEAMRLKKACEQERSTDRIDAPDSPLHPRNFLTLERALEFAKNFGVRDRQTDLSRYRVPASEETEKEIEQAILCTETEICMRCEKEWNKMMFNPDFPCDENQQSEEEAAEAILARQGDEDDDADDDANDADYYSTSSEDDDDDDEEDEEDSTTTSSSSSSSDMQIDDGVAVPEEAVASVAPPPPSRVCTKCTSDTKVCIKCREKLHLRYYDDARAPICMGCRWIYVFPKPHSCWRMHIDDVSPDGLENFSLPRTKIQDNPDAGTYDPFAPVDDNGGGFVGNGIMDSCTDEHIDQWSESMRQGTNNLLRPGLDPQTAALVSLSEKIVERSRLLQLRRELLPRRMQIEDRYVSNPQRFQQEMGKFKEEACLKFWERIFPCEPASEFADVTIKGMAYLKKHMEDCIWPEHNQVFPNLSIYGNMRLFYHVNFTRHFRLKEGLMPRALWKLMLARDSALEYDYGLHVNILEDGEGSTGKSYNMDCMIELSFEGSIHKTTHISPQAFNTDQDWNYVCILMHECPLGYLGIDQYGHPVEGCEFIKDRLTSNVCLSFRCNWEGGSASRVATFSRCMGNMILATNANPPPTDTPLMQRFLREVVIKYPGGSYDVADIAEPMGDEMDQQTKDLFVHESRMRHVFIMLVERAIEAAFFHDVNTNLAVMYFKPIFKRLHEKYKIADTPIRVRHMLLKLCRIACIKHAVYWEYCTETNRWRFEKDGKTFREFDPHSLINLERKLVVTEEMIADILSLFQDSFIPTLTQKFLEQCKTLSGLGSPKPISQRLYKRVSLGHGKRDMVDLNYVEFDEGTLAKFYDRIWNMTKGALTPGIISAKLLELKKRFIEVDNRNYKQPPAPSQPGRRGVPQQQHHQAAAAAPKRQLGRQNPNEQIHEPRISIPCAEVLQKGGSRRAQSVCIAIEAMLVKLDEAALSETLQWAFSHAWARPRRIITSFVHIGPDNYSYPHLLDTIDVEIVPNRVVSIRNHLAITKLDEACVYNRVLSDTHHTRNAGMASDFITIWGEDAETSTFRMHWRRIGAFWTGWADERFRPLTPVTVSDLPWVYMERLWNYRNGKEKKTYDTLEIFNTYPDELRLLHKDRIRSAEHHMRELEAGEKGITNLSSCLSEKNNPQVITHMYRNWGLTPKDLIDRTTKRRKEAEIFFDETVYDSIESLPSKEIWSRGFVMRRKETINITEQIQRGSKADEEDDDFSDFLDASEGFSDDDDHDDDDDILDLPLSSKRDRPTPAAAVKGPEAKKSRTSHRHSSFSSSVSSKKHKSGLTKYLQWKDYDKNNKGGGGGGKRSNNNALYALIHNENDGVDSDTPHPGQTRGLSEIANGKDGLWEEDQHHHHHNNRARGKERHTQEREQTRRSSRKKALKQRKQRRKLAVKKKRLSKKFAKKTDYSSYRRSQSQRRMGSTFGPRGTSDSIVFVGGHPSF